MISKFYASTLAEFYGALNDVKEDFKDNGKELRFQFRGHGHNYYNLIPTLYRGQFFQKNGNNTYTQMNLKEDYRYQHFKARAFHYVDSNPVYKSEWQEIYQHHFGHTRLMDWTESARTALSFALEPFIDTRANKELEYKRYHCTPCVWVLNPYELNKKVYGYMGEKLPTDIKKSRTMCRSWKDWLPICEEIKNHREIYFDGNKSDLEIKGVISLCALEDYRKSFGEGFKRAVYTFEFKPFYYLALRIYSDAVPYSIETYDQEILPPMALLHPYHSNRIRTQRGAFTMFPNYFLEEGVEKKCKNRNRDIRNMEEQDYISGCLKVIYIINPHEIARELMLSGERRSELYPDIQTYADMIETQKYYC